MAHKAFAVILELKDTVHHTSWMIQTIRVAVIPSATPITRAIREEIFFCLVC